MVAFGGDENLGLVLQPPERLRMDYPVPVSLEFGANGARRLRGQTSPGADAQRRKRAEKLGLTSLDLFADAAGYPMGLPPRMPRPWRSPWVALAT